MSVINSIISVVIPCYNKENCIAEALNSVMDQTYRNAIREIVVIDDGSEDMSAAIVQQMSVSCPLIRYLYQDNAGVSAARNRGIEQAEGEYIAFLDADDIWLPDKIEKQYKALLRHPGTALFYTDLFKYDDEKQQLQPVKAIAYAADEENLLFRFVAKGAPVIPSTVLVKKNCFETAGLFDTSLHEGGEDIDMWLRIAKHYSFQHVPGFLIKKRELPGSLGANTFENAKGYKIALDKMQKAEPAIAPYRRKRDAVIHYKVGLYFYKRGEHKQALNEARKAFRKDYTLLKTYALCGAIICKQIGNGEIFKSL